MDTVVDSAMTLSRRFEDALVFAARTHADHLRKGTEIPYVAHLLSVAGIALTYGADEDEAIAALLHDAVEDRGGAATREEIRARFGNRVTAIVDACSDTNVKPKPPWRERKEAYIAHLREASRSARLVSAADKLDNARAILADYRVLGEGLWSRFNAGREDTLWYYRSIVETLERFSDMPPLVGELRKVVEEIERVAAPVHPGLLRAKAVLAEAGLDCPPIPPELAPGFQERERWWFSTEPPGRWSPYAYFPFVETGSGTDVRDYVLLAHAGHGVNSYAVHYYLVRGPLHLFLQMAWGGAYGGSKDTTEVNSCFALLERLIPAVEAALRTGRLRADDRLIIAASDMSGSYWMKPGEQTQAQERSERPRAILTEVVRWIEDE